MYLAFEFLFNYEARLEMCPSLGSISKFETDFKAQTRSILIFQGSIKLFFDSNHT